MSAIEPFTLNIPEPVITDLRERLARTRFSEPFNAEGWGVEHEALRDLVEHWRGFDWRAAEAGINAFPAFRTMIDGVGLHFVHVRGEGGERTPLVLTNGWPSCFTELLPLIPFLTREVAGRSFDVVIPSLPGYGFSDQARAPGMTITRIADLWAGLMSRLGHERFLAHGSDMGAGVVERLRANHGDRLLGVHMVNVNWFYPCPTDVSREEQAYLGAAGQWQAQEGAYAAIHVTKPQTIAVGLNDSPAGLAAWIGEKFSSWTESPISMDALCTVLTIYWVTGSIGSSQRLYREAFGDAGVMGPPPKVGAPVAVAVFPYDILPAPRSWGERWFDVAQWTVMPRGGHFPGFEAPGLLADDLRSFVARLSVR